MTLHHIDRSCFFLFFFKFLVLFLVLQEIKRKNFFFYYKQQQVCFFNVFVLLSCFVQFNSRGSCGGIVQNVLFFFQSQFFLEEQDPALSKEPCLSNDIYLDEISPTTEVSV